MGVRGPLNSRSAVWCCPVIVKMLNYVAGAETERVHMRDGQSNPG